MAVHTKAGDCILGKRLVYEARKVRLVHSLGKAEDIEG